MCDWSKQPVQHQDPTPIASAADDTGDVDHPECRRQTRNQIFMIAPSRQRGSTVKGRYFVRSPSSWVQIIRNVLIAAGGTKLLASTLLHAQSYYTALSDSITNRTSSEIQ